MQKKIKFAMITAFLMLSLATISSASAAQYNLNDSSYSNYFNTSGYINNTSVHAGDVFDISGDINNKDMYIDRPLNITSSARTGQIINGTITILSGGSGTNVTYLNITNTKVDDNSYGIHLIESGNNRIIGNNITTTGNGSGTSGGNGYFTYGVYLEDSNNNVFDSNTIKTTGVSADADWSTWPNPAKYATIGVYLNYDSSNNNFTNNTITTNYNHVVTAWGYDTLAGVRVNTGTDNQFTGNHINTNGNAYIYGVEIVGSSSSTASDNVVSGNVINTNGQVSAQSVKIGTNTLNTIVSQNIIKSVGDSFAYGIYLEGAPSNLHATVTGNKATTIANINYVLELFSASENTITDNVFMGIGNYSLGIGAYKSNNNTIKYNTITTMGDNSAEHIDNDDSIPEGNEGIKLYENSSQNTVQYNIINSNAEYTIDTSDSSNNTITNNYLISDNGNKQGNNAVAPGTGNTITDNYGKKPVAAFTVNTNNGPGPLTVQFIDTSLGDITDWEWDFDNNSVVDCCEAQYSTYTYTKPGTYIAKLKVTGPGGSDSKIIYITVTDATKPTITSVNPANNKIINVANKALVITFSEAIKAGSAFTSIKVTNPDGVSVKPLYKVINGKTLTLTRNGNYINGLTYTITLPTNSITDTAGNTLATAFTSKFTVDFAKPTITRVNPANNKVINVANKAIVITFSENIKAGSAFSNIKVTNPDGVSVKPLYKVINGKTLTLTRNGNYINGLTYTITLPTNSITDTAGNTLATVFTSKFKIDTTRPKITNTNPTNNTINFSLTAPITIKFNKNIIKGTNYSKIYLKNLSTGKLVSITASIQRNTLTIQMTKSRLHYNTYQLHIPAAAVKDQTGNSVASYTLKFKTS